MWTRPRGRARSVDRGTRRPGIEPRNRVRLPGAEAVSGAEGNTRCTENGEVQRDLARSYAKTPSMRGSAMRENRETLRPPAAMALRAAVGSLRTQSTDARQQGV